MDCTGVVGCLITPTVLPALANFTRIDSRFSIPPMRLIFSGKRAIEAFGLEPVADIDEKSFEEKPSRMKDLGLATQKMNLLRFQKMNSSVSI